MQLRDRARRSLGGSACFRGGTFTLGQDIKLYRSELNTICLDSNDNLTVGGTISATGGIKTKQATGAVAVTTLTNNGDFQVQICGGTPRLVAMVAGTTYYWDKTG